MKKALALGCSGTLSGLLYFNYKTQQVPEPVGEPYQQLPKLRYEDHPNKHYLTKVPKKIGIIGAGLSGLCTAKELRIQGYEVEVLERREGLGGTWFKNYPELRLLGRNFHYHLPDYPIPQSGFLHAAQPELKSWLESYAEEFAVTPLISFNSSVSKFEQEEDGSWTVHIEGSKPRNYDFLVLCQGLYNTPVFPEIPERDKFKGTALHSSQVASKDIFENKKVVIIGAGRSAQELGRVASDQTDSVTVLANKTYLTVDPTQPLTSKYLYYLGICCKLATRFMPPFDDDDPAFIYNYCKPLVYLFKKFLTYGDTILPEELKCSTDPSKSFPIYIVGCDSKYIEKVREKKIKVIRGKASRFTQQGLLVGEKEVEADVVVYATGFKPNFFGFDKNPDDLWLYRYIIHPGVKNLAFIGVINALYLPTVINLQAVWLCEVLRGALALPSFDKMTEQVRKREKRFKEVFTETKISNTAWLPPYPFIEMYLKDMNLPIKRNKSLKREWLYMPNVSDYKPVITHRI